MATPTAFKIHIPDSLLAQTKQKLELSRLPDQLDNVQWEGYPPLLRLEVDE